MLLCNLIESTKPNAGLWSLLFYFMATTMLNFVSRTMYTPCKNYRHTYVYVQCSIVNTAFAKCIHVIPQQHLKQ